MSLLNHPGFTPPPARQDTGLFITFEGIDGAGKTTQMTQLADWFKHQQPERPVILTRNPGGTRLGQALRHLLLTPEAETGVEPITPWSEVFLYLADRVHHLDTVVRPALAAGGVVLCDRFSDSTIAYQGYGRGLPVADLILLNRLAIQECEPNLTFLFDGPPEVLLARARKRQADGVSPTNDRFEQEKLAFFERVREGFQTLATHNPTRIVTLDALKTPEAIQQAILQVIT